MLIITSGDDMINFYKTLLNSNNSNNKILNDSINDFDFRMCENNNTKICIINKCPYCKSKEIIKYGMYKNIQRYKCKDDMCGKTFTNEIYNKFRYSKKFRENWQEYFKLLTKGFTIRECASNLISFKLILSYVYNFKN